MSFNAHDIAGMLTEYENDHHTGMDIQKLSQLIYDYTSGYPVLVSMICKYMDEKFAGIPSPAPLSLSFSDEAVAVSIGDKKETVPLSDCSAVEFEGMLAIDFGHFCGLCFTFGELGEAADDIRAILRAKGERYQFLERDGKSWQLYNDELRVGANGVPSSRA